MSASMRLILLLAALLSTAAQAQETVIEEAPVPAAEVQDAPLPGQPEAEAVTGTTAAFINEPPANFDPAHYATQIRAVEDYLSSFKTLHSRFSQTTYGRAVIVQGTLSISRPGRMLLEYLRPERLRITVNGKRLRYYDYQLDQVTYGEIPDTPFEVLLYEKVVFDGTSEVVNVMEDDTSLAITVRPKKDTTADKGYNFSSLTLVFAKNPMQLKRIMRADALNHTTTIHLLDTELDVPLEEELFSMKNPTKKKKK
jgi:outer membrane lipoprotein-sorting protein